MKILVTLGVAAILALVPIQFPELPLNLELADVLGFAVLPLFWIWVLGEGRGFRLPYLGAMGLLLAVTGISALFSVEPARGLMVILKEVYLYAWFVSIANAMALTGESGFRLLAKAWLAGAVVNGLFIVLQFLHPPLLGTMNGWVSSVGMLDPYRPSGFFSNCNVGAFYQVLSFVPLIALDWPTRRLVPFGLYLFLTVFCTGSMGALLALVAGLGIGVGLLAFLFNEWTAVLRLSLGVGLLGGLFAGAVFLAASFDPELSERLDAMLFSRADRSAGSRFEIWGGGLRLVFSGVPLTGVGPEQYKQIGGKELHNDLISFTVERGLLGTGALLILVVVAMARALEVMRLGISQGRRWTLVFPAAVVATCVEAMTHEVFHMRQVWMALAIQEAVLWKSRIEVGRLPSETS